MIINQTGVSAPFTFAGTGDEYIVGGTITNLTNLASATISAASAGNKVTNNGMIAAFGGKDAIALSGGGTVVNNGVISGTVRASGMLTMTNTGTFVGSIIAYTSAGSPGSIITNSGSMTTAGVAGGLVQLGLGDDKVVNSGRMLGDVNLGEGSNTFDGRGGTILGTVFSGGGNDLFFLTQDITIVDTGGIDTINARMTHTLGLGFENLTLGGFGNFSGTGNTADNRITGNTSNNILDGAGGQDTLLGGGGGDTIIGGTGNDSLDGNNGNDRLDGGFGNDTVAGSDGNDRVVGDVGSDSLSGGNGSDSINGGFGADTMDGGDGADVLTGGAFGSDLMTGGAGADRFVFTGVDDSLATRAADRITDFETGVDKFAFEALVPGLLVFTGTGAFDGTVPSVRVIQVAGDTIVQIDLDSNGRADMQVYLTGLLTLSAGDFML